MREGTGTGDGDVGADDIRRRCGNIITRMNVICAHVFGFPPNICFINAGAHRKVCGGALAES